MNLRKLLSRRIATANRGVHVAADVNSIVSASVGEPGRVASASRSQRTRIVQRGGHTVVSEKTAHGGSFEGDPRRGGADG